MSDYINRIADLMDDDEAPLDDYNDEFGDPQGLASQILQGFDFTLPLADAISEIREYGLRHNISKSMIDLACRYLLTVDLERPRALVDPVNPLVGLGSNPTVSEFSTVTSMVEGVPDETPDEPRNAIINIAILKPHTGKFIGQWLDKLVKFWPPVTINVWH